MYPPANKDPSCSTISEYIEPADTCTEFSSTMSGLVMFSLLNCPSASGAPQKKKLSVSLVGDRVTSGVGAKVGDDVGGSDPEAKPNATV